MKAKFGKILLLLTLLALPLSAMLISQPVATAYMDDDDEEDEEAVDSTALQTSKLEMPNAFSPNGDEINDIYRAKPTYQNITEFHAVIYNRWGQKIFAWSNIDGGWDGTHNGKPVKAGVYFVRVRAKGGDGKSYDIKRDVNLLRDFNEVTESGNE